MNQPEPIEPKPSHAPKSRGKLIRRIVEWLICLIIISALAVGGFSAKYVLWAMEFDLGKVEQMPETSFIYDRNGHLVQRIFEEHRIRVEGEEIAPIMKQALIATEDQRFYHHFGFDPIGIARALFSNTRGGGIQSGASTITQQLARNTAGMFERTLDRKIKELFLAMRIETAYSKDEILTHYLNRVFFGRHVFGIGAAARDYFGKTASELTLSESALLAGILSGPNSFSPWRNPDKAKQARERALTRMEKCGYISQAELVAARDEPLVLRPMVELPGSHAIAAIMEQIGELIPQEEINKGGLKIFTTLDMNFQETSERELELALQQIENRQGYPRATRLQWLSNPKNSPPNYLQASFVAVENATGGILAMVGGRNYEESTFNRALHGPRQVGSSLKPFVYANLFNQSSASALTRINGAEFDLHAPVENAWSSWDSRSAITIRTALEQSNNFAAMRAGLAGGVGPFASLVQAASGQPVAAHPSSILGACELTPLSLVRAYTVFPNMGAAVHPYLIDSVQSADGRILHQHTPAAYTILTPHTAFRIHHILEGVVENGTAQRLRWDWKITTPLAGKTGTTNDYKDAWFVGYNSEITAGVWVGMDEPATIFPGAYSHLTSVPVWGRIMKVVLEHYPGTPITPPDGLILTQQTSGVPLISFFEKTVATGPQEYVPQEMIEQTLARIDAPLQLGQAALEPSEPRGFFDSLFGPDEPSTISLSPVRDPRRTKEHR